MNKKNRQTPRALRFVGSIKWRESINRHSPKKTEIHSDPIAEFDDVEATLDHKDFPLEQTGWLEKNPDALTLVKTGIAQAQDGKVKRMSFVEYAELEIDD